MGTGGEFLLSDIVRSKPATLADISRMNKLVRPDNTGVIFEGRELTFSDLDGAANRVATGLAALGVQSQNRIGYIGKNDPAFYEVMFGVAKLNAVLVSLNWRLAPKELKAVIDDSEIRVVFASDEYAASVCEIIEGLGVSVQVINLGQLPSRGGSLIYEDWKQRQSAIDPLSDIGDDDICFQLYTSGTTGRPKGVQITNKSVIALLENCTEIWRFYEPNIVSLIVLPNFHVGGINWSLMNFYAGDPVVLMREFDMKAVGPLVERYKITSLNFVPSMISMLMQEPSVGQADLSSLRIIVFGGSPMPAEVLRAAQDFFKCEFSQTYALTETTGQITAISYGDYRDRSEKPSVSCGKPFPGTHLRIVDPQGAELPVGASGEIVVTSVQNTPGYWRQDSATRELFRSGWLHTGDVGYLDEDGNLYVHDRIKDMIVSGGENIYPAEVENALIGHPSVADVAVVGQADARWGETVKAFVVFRPGRSATPDELTTHCRSQIAGYKVPRIYKFIENLPRNGAGKIKKFVLRED